MLLALSSRSLRHSLFARKVPTFLKPIRHRTCTAQVDATQQSNGRGPIVKLLVFSLKAMALSVTISMAAVTYQGYRLYTTVNNTLPNMVTYPNPEENAATDEQMSQHYLTVSLGSTSTEEAKSDLINKDIEETKYKGLLKILNSFCWLGLVAAQTDFNNEEEMANIFTLNKQKVQEIVDGNAFSKLWFYLRFDIKNYVLLPVTIDLNVFQQNSKTNIQKLHTFLKAEQDKDKTQCFSQMFLPTEINAYIDVLADFLYMYSTSRQHNRANNGSRDFSASDLYRVWVIGYLLRTNAIIESNALDTRVDLLCAVLDPFNTGHVEKQDLLTVYQLSIKANNIQKRFMENSSQDTDLQMIEETPAMKQFMLSLEDVMQDADVLIKSDFYRETNNVAFVDHVCALLRTCRDGW